MPSFQPNQYRSILNVVKNVFAYVYQSIGLPNWYHENTQIIDFRLKPTGLFRICLLLLLSLGVRVSYLASAIQKDRTDNWNLWFEWNEIFNRINSWTCCQCSESFDLIDNGHECNTTKCLMDFIWTSILIRKIHFISVNFWLWCFNLVICANVWAEFTFTNRYCWISLLKSFSGKWCVCIRARNWMSKR